MPLALLLIAAAVVVAVLVLTPRTAPERPISCADWHSLTVSALCDAERLLDWLEARGVEERELVVLGQSTFAVRWR